VPARQTDWTEGQRNPDLVTPRQLCNNLLHKLLVRVRFSKRAHIFQVPGSKSTHFRERFGQVLRQAINDFCAPSFILLATQDVTANAPINKGQQVLGLQKEPPEPGLSGCGPSTLARSCRTRQEADWIGSWALFALGFPALIAYLTDFREGGFDAPGWRLRPPLPTACKYRT
jgi:hypothetical protein